MVGIYHRRKSIAAHWCLRFAVIAIPYLVLTVYLHRRDAVTTPQAFWLLAFGIALVIGSILFGMKAAVDLWQKGYKGGRATVNGLALSILLLLPFGYQLILALDRPQLNDVATDVVSPPPFMDSDATERPANYEPFHTRLIIGEYPEIVTRRYNAPPERVLRSVDDIMQRWKWRVVATRNIPEQERPEENVQENTKTDNGQLAGGEQEEETVPVSEQNESLIPDIYIQALAQSMIMKLESDIAIRLVDDGDSTLVDMRSASNWGPHDFGSNARNIENFFAELDVLLAGVAGE